MTPREKIRARRIELGMSQGELARRSGFADRSAISKIERGLSKMSPEKTMAVAHALRMNPADLCNYNNIEDSPVELGMLISKVMADPVLLNAIEKYYELPEKAQQAILSMIDAY